MPDGRPAYLSILVGFGFGLMYVPSVVAVANHFTKWVFRLYKKYENRGKCVVTESLVQN